MTTSIVDVSHHDRDRLGHDLDWARILPATSPAMIAKLTEGDPGGYWFIDPYGTRACVQAAAEGAQLRVGYHCLSRGDQASINRQVDGLRRQLDAAGAGAAMADIEPFQELVDRGIWPRWIDVQRLHDRWYAVEDRCLSWYIPHWFWERTPVQTGLGSPDLTQLRGPLISSDYGANYATNPAVLYAKRGGDAGPGWDPYGGRTPDLWQAGSRCMLPGASSTTDISFYRGTAPELVATLTGGDMPTAQEIAAAVLTAKYNDYVDPDGDGKRTPVTVIDALLRARADAYAANLKADAVLAALGKIGSGDPDVAAILAGVDERLAQLRTAVREDVRDAVADEAEGGAAAVRTG
jgi:hypothetical protein